MSICYTLGGTSTTVTRPECICLPFLKGWKAVIFQDEQAVLVNSILTYQPKSLTFLLVFQCNRNVSPQALSLFITPLNQHYRKKVLMAGHSWEPPEARLQHSTVTPRQSGALEVYSTSPLTCDRAKNSLYCWPGSFHRLIHLLTIVSVITLEGHVDPQSSQQIVRINEPG